MPCGPRQNGKLIRFYTQQNRATGFKLPWGKGLGGGPLLSWNNTTIQVHPKLRCRESVGLAAKAVGESNRWHVDMSKQWDMWIIEYMIPDFGRRIRDFFWYIFTYMWYVYTACILHPLHFEWMLANSLVANKQTDRDRQKDGQIDRQINRWTHKWINRQVDRQLDRQTEGKSKVDG